MTDYDDHFPQLHEHNNDTDTLEFINTADLPEEYEEESDFSDNSIELENQFYDGDNESQWLDEINAN